MPAFTATLTFFSQSGLTHTGNQYLIENTSGTGRISFIVNGNAISLNGAPAIPFASLPSGFRITSMTFRQITSLLNPAFVRRGNVANTCSALGRFSTYSNTTNATTAGTSFPANVTVTLPINVTALLAFLTWEFTLVQNVADVLLKAFAFDNPEISGNYIIEAFTWDANIVGNNVVITSDGISPDLTTVDNIILSYEDADGIVRTITVDSFTTQTASQITFPIPELCTYTGGVLVYATIGTTQIVVDTLTIV